MAQDAEMHKRLTEWAQWLMVGDGSGFPTMSVLHEDWSPPSPGVTPTMKVGASSLARQTHRVMRSWSTRLRNTVMVYYCSPALPVAWMAQQLGCAERTLHCRIEIAHRLLRAALVGSSALSPHAASRLDSGNLGASARKR